MTKNTITRLDMKNTLKLNTKILADDSHIEQYLNARLLYEKDLCKREAMEQELASIEERRKRLTAENKGITDLLALNVIDIIIEEGEKGN